MTQLFRNVLASGVNGSEVSRKQAHTNVRNRLLFAERRGGLPLKSKRGR